jgi:hypothetical protein
VDLCQDGDIQGVFGNDVEKVIGGQPQEPLDVQEDRHCGVVPANQEVLVQPRGVVKMVTAGLDYLFVGGLLLRTYAVNRNLMFCTLCFLFYSYVVTQLSAQSFQYS